MKIWVIGRSFPNKKNKNIGSFEFEQAKMLAKKGNEVTYLALVFHPFKKINNWGYSTWQADNITICAYSQFYIPERLNLHLSTFQTSKWIQFLQRVEKQCGLPDVIHVHYPTMITEADAVLAYQAKAAKVVVTEHWTKVLTGELKKHHIDRLISYAQRADAFLSVGKPLKDSVQKLTGACNNLHVVPNIVSEMFLQQKKDKSDKSYFEFITVGRLVPVKQFDKAIEAYYAAFGNKNEKVKLTIVGGGSEEKKLRQLIAQYQLEKSVVLTGSLNREETARKVANADILVCFSRLETFGVPVIEAWACGLPVVATDALGFLEYWSDGLGKIVSWKSVDEMAAAMENMYKHYGEYDANQISEFANRNFSEDAVYSQLMALYSGE